MNGAAMLPQEATARATHRLHMQQRAGLLRERYGTR